MFRLLPKNVRGDIPNELPIALQLQNTEPYRNKIIWVASKKYAKEHPEIKWFKSLSTAGKFIPLPEVREGMRDVVYLTAPSGIGKSTFAAEMTTRFIDTFERFIKVKDKTGRPIEQVVMPRVFIVSTNNPADDKAYKRLTDSLDNPVEWVYLSPRDILEQQPVLSDIEGIDMGLDRDGDPIKMPSLVIFDDIEGGVDKREEHAMNKFMQLILETGRKRKIYCYIISHRPCDGVKTKISLIEKTAIWMPTDCDGGTIKRLYKHHLSIDDEVRQYFKRYNELLGRWVYLKTTGNIPYIISEHRIFLLDSEKIKHILLNNTESESDDDIGDDLIEHPKLFDRKLKF